MAGTMQWFQVSCPTCAAQLQVRLPEGITSVQCSQCKAVFAVQIQPTALAHQAARPFRLAVAAHHREVLHRPRLLGVLFLSGHLSERFFSGKLCCQGYVCV